MGSRLLFDRNSRRKPLNVIDVGLLHHRQELPSVGRQRFHIAALALCVERIEGERRLTRAREAGNDHELVARDRNIDVFEIVRAGTAYDDLIHALLFLV